jgi:hypothetical protein
VHNLGMELHQPGSLGGKAGQLPSFSLLLLCCLSAWYGVSLGCYRTLKNKSNGISYILYRECTDPCCN